MAAVPLILLAVAVIVLAAVHAPPHSWIALALAVVALLMAAGVAFGVHGFR